jgi:hypothetical protein
MNRFNQNDIHKFNDINYKEIDTTIYTLKINSKSRNLLNEPNPFNFELTFNENLRGKETSIDNNGNLITSYFNNNKAIIGNKFDHIKKIQIAQILIPRFIPRDYMGEPFNGITPIYNSHNTITLSYYPGININNTVISVFDLNDVSTKIEVLELVDLNNKKIYLLSINYNNPYYLSKYINIKAELYSYLNINNNIYPIININGTLIELGNTTNYPLPSYTNNRLIIGDYYKNVTYVDDNGNKIGYICNQNNKGIIYINGSNILNYQYIFSGQYLEYQLIDKTTKHSEYALFLINNITSTLIDPLLADTVENTKIIINGIWTDRPPVNYNNTNDIIFNHNNNLSIRLNQFNFGVRDLLDDKIFYLNMYPYTPNKLVATESTVNDTFGVFFPSTQSKDYLYLRGDAFENYNITNLQNTNNKIKFSLLDSNYEQVGTIYNKFFNLYQPKNLLSINSYLPNAPDVTIIMKIEQIERKNINQSIV